LHRIPSRYELAILAAMAVACAAVVGLAPRHDYAMMFATMPLFTVAALMGLRRSGQLKLREAKISDAENEPVP